MTLQLDYWLIDLNIDYTATNTFGDILALNGVVYNHLIKTKQLLPEFKVVGKKVSFECHFTNNKVTTTGCTVTSPSTYSLKEMDVIAALKPDSFKPLAIQLALVGQHGRRKNNIMYQISNM